MVQKISLAQQVAGSRQVPENRSKRPEGVGHGVEYTEILLWERLLAAIRTT